jgi:hypothetical protein
VAERAAADLDSAAAALGLGIAATEESGKPLTGHAELVDALSVAAGVPVVLDAVSADYRRRAARHMGWPFTRWVARLRPDPLKRLRLGKVEDDVRNLARTSLPAPSQAQRARVDLALRSLTRQAAADLPQRWAEAVRDVAGKSEADVSDALDTAVLSVDLAYPDPPWWRAVAGLHLVLAAAAVAGFLWLTLLSVLGWLQVPPGDAPRWGPFPVPTVLLLGGLLGGLALAWLGRWLAARGARRRRNTLAARLREAILARAQSLVLQPVSEVLERHRAVREHLEAARS